MRTSGFFGVGIGTSTGRHRRDLLLSERVIGSTPFRAAVTALAIAAAGLTLPFVAPASADESAPVAPVSYLVTFAAGTSADDQLRVWRETSDVKAVVDRLIEMTMENVPREVIPVTDHSASEPLLV